MAKIDTINVAGTPYEIDLPSTATPSITSLTVNGDLIVKGTADLKVISENEVDEAFEAIFNKVEVDKNTTVKKLLDARKSASSLFSGYDGTSVNDLIEYNDTSNVITMDSMFSDCSNLMSIPLLNTSNVANMVNMFYKCSNLTNIPLLDTSKVTNMSSMF